jgi:altronate dehydratase
MNRRAHGCARFDDLLKTMYPSRMPIPIPFDSVARLPAPGDNAAMALRTLEAGTRIAHPSGELVLSQTILLGHRFALRPLQTGDALLSWGLPFGMALRPIAAGAYICNAAMLEALSTRPLPFKLPAEPNFRDLDGPYLLDETGFRPGQQVPRVAKPRFFDGYRRSPARGVGTRNMIVLLGTNSRVGGFVRLLETRLKGLAAGVPNLDGIVAAAHTEGAGPDPLNNTDLLLRTLAGFMVHPNVGAVLAVDDGAGPVSNDTLREYLLAHGYPLGEVLHRFWSLSGDLTADLDQGEAWVRAWLAPVSGLPRSPQPMAALSVALQCGGSDAFSGISANPLAAAVARRVVANGGRANLAETTELIGAEAYLLANVRDLDTARACLAFIERYKTMLAWHGVTGEGNLSGGNRYRGLYNIALKSIGAATKRDPAVRLDDTVDYAERMLEPGYYFMNTPGNDLESIAGQVAGGSNLIIFTTGNGSITNFPFVPTIKVMTTTARYKLLTNEMDVNAGAFLDGTPLEQLAGEMFELTTAIASGTRSKGELAGHSQVSIWRNWRQTGATPVEELMARPEPGGRSLPIRTDDVIGANIKLAMLRQGGRFAADQVGLVLPTSLCAGQVARLAAGRLNQLGLGREQGLSRFVALVHTEGCGSAGYSTGQLYSRTLLGYMAHGLVGAGLFLEHGCERTHNDYMRSQLAERGLGSERFGWASVQLDGGIEAVLGKIEDWFRQSLAQTQPPTVETTGLGALKLGLISSGALPAGLGAALAQVTRSVVAAGGTVVVAQSASLLETPSFLQGTLGAAAGGPSLGYGQTATVPGFHIMETPSGHWVETLTGLGATGVEVLLACPGERPAQGHPMIPMLQASAGSAPRDGFDWAAQGDPGQWAEQLLDQVAEVASRRYTPRRFAQGDVDFQMTRGLLGLTV